MAQYPFEAVLKALQEKYRQDKLNRQQPIDNVAGALNTVATGYYNNVVGEKKRQQELANQKGLLDYQTALETYKAQSLEKQKALNDTRQAEYGTWLKGEGAYRKPVVVPTGEFVGQATGKTYNGMPVASPVPETTQEIRPYSPTAEEALTGTAGAFIPQGKTDGHYWIGKNNQTYVLDGNKLVPGAPQPGWTPHNLNEEAPYADLQKTRLQSNLITQFNNDAAVKKNRLALDAATVVRDLAMDDNPISHASIPTYMARLMGEVGALSEADKKPYGGSRSIVEKLKQIESEAVSGKMTADNRKYIADLATLIEKRNNENMARTARRMAKQFAKQGVYGNEEEIFGTFMPDYVPDLAGDQGGQPNPNPGPNPGGLKVGDIQDGYKYKGGDPADPNSWEVSK